MTENLYKEIINKHKDKNLGFVSISSGRSGNNHSLWYSNDFYKRFNKYGIRYISHSLSNMSLSSYFYFDYDIEIRVSDHNLKENDVDYREVGQSSKTKKLIHHIVMKIRNIRNEKMS